MDTCPRGVAAHPIKANLIISLNSNVIKHDVYYNNYVTP